MTAWISTTKGYIRADQIIAADIVHLPQNGPHAEHLRIEFTCLNGLTFAGPATLVGSDRQPHRFRTIGAAHKRLLTVLGVIQRRGPQTGRKDTP